jgi:hypothetical protein
MLGPIPAAKACQDIAGSFLVLVLISLDFLCVPRIIHDLASYALAQEEEPKCTAVCCKHLLP